MPKNHSNPKSKPGTFSERVIAVARSIPSGRVMTYGMIARAAGGTPITAQSITHILGKAWMSGIHDIPFHRIVYSDGRIWTHSKHHKKRGDWNRLEKQNQKF